jgi:hypothetical protein
MEALWRNENNKLRLDKVPDEISGIVNEIILPLQPNLNGCRTE